MSIPLAMSPVGYDTWVTELRRALITYLGTLHLEVDYFPDEKKLVVHTDRVSDETYAEVAYIVSKYMPSGVTLEQYNHHWEVSWKDINKYANCKTIGDMHAVNSDYKNDVTSEGEWIYPLPELVASDAAFGYGVFTDSSKIKIFKHELPKVSNLRAMFAGSSIEEVEIATDMPMSSIYMILSGSKCRKCTLNAKNATDARFAIQGGQAANYLEELYVDMPKATRFWTYGAKLNKESVLQIAENLQVEGSTVLGIHVDYKNDEEVLAAIASLEAKGRTVAVQWNGTATANA